jgi:heme/copper-type cytochrome/quinol oxidase subunit 3
MEASAPSASHLQSEPPEWQPRAIWVGGRLLCGSISFFFASFLFAFFYLQALDVNHNWKIGAVHPSKGLGVAIMALFLFGAVVYRLSAKREQVDVLLAGTLAIVFSLVAVGLQFLEYTKLDFGASQGGYAAVFFGWTALYAIVALFGLYWIEIQIANLWRVRREGERPEALEGVAVNEAEVLRAGIEASSFYWAYFVAIGVLAYIVLYIV